MYCPPVVEVVKKDKKKKKKKKNLTFASWHLPEFTFTFFAQSFVTCSVFQNPEPSDIGNFECMYKRKKARPGIDYSKIV